MPATITHHHQARGPSPLQFLHLSHRKLQSPSLDADLRESLLIRNAVIAAEREARRREARFTQTHEQQWRPVQTLASTSRVRSNAHVEIVVLEPDTATYAADAAPEDEDDAEWFERTWRELNAEEEQRAVQRQTSSRGRKRAEPPVQEMASPEIAPHEPPTTPRLRPTVIYDQFYEPAPAPMKRDLASSPATEPVESDSESDSDSEEPVTPPGSLAVDDFEFQHYEDHEGCMDFDFGGPADPADVKRTSQSLFA